MMKFIIYSMSGALLLGASCGAHAVELISAKEAQLPAASGALSTRGISRGPGVKVVSPDPAAAEIKSPFDLKIQFESRGGKKIDPAAVKLTYVKAYAVDLTPRVASAITENGIDFSKAEVPPGEHAVKITVKDVEGRETNTVITLNVTK